MSDDFLGLNFKIIVAGVGGGISILYAMKKPEAWELVAGLVVGGFTANYVTPGLYAIIPLLSHVPDLTVAFFVGIGGKLICKFGLDYWKYKTQTKRQ